ncbi:Zinc-finger of the MIZ type in Nse subunit [Phytophthora infestans]|uniref:Zinc-finger of the MIZ type in Nse subunit n=1 Tax=Phytophthora infestans TaxID=4787 RepID=A0A8S9UDJ2_PHYIN|nr:Zinc-finger of the MIZ type in Nse subunit [Phytophthora infestans]
MNSQQQETVVDLTAQTDTDAREHGAHTIPQPTEFIDLTEDTTTTAPFPSRNARQKQKMLALQNALDQANDDLTTFRDKNCRFLDEQEAALTCPISYELFENPVVTECCGKTFSREALTEVLRWNPHCPMCRAPVVRTHSSRDVANLVEIYRKHCPG